MENRNRALVLTGGGARGAYQAGVLKYIAENIPGAHFETLVGSSSGAINVAGLASFGGNVQQAGVRVAELWSDLQMNEVFRTDPLSIAAIGLRWLYDLILGRAVAWAIGSADPREIDRYNILVATHLAMSRALRKLGPGATAILIDGNQPPPAHLLPEGCKVMTVIGGDGRSLSIAAASIGQVHAARLPDGTPVVVKVRRPEVRRTIDLDLRILNAMGEGKGRSLTDLPKGALNSGSSEIRNWILVAGAIEKMKKRWFEYQALYRQAAGTGIGVAFGVWEN